MSNDGEFRDRVLMLVKHIPKGRVMTYGQIAALAGSPRAARIVGGIAHYGDPDLPWQRVVNKQGGLASTYTNGGRDGHKAALEADSVKVDRHYQVKVEEGHSGSIAVCHRGIRWCYSFHHKQEQAERWRPCSHLYIEQEYYGEPHRVKAQSMDDGHKYGQSDHHYRHTLHKGAHQQDQNHHAYKDKDGGEGQSHGKFNQASAGSRKGKHLGKGSRSGDDYEQHE